MKKTTFIMRSIAIALIGLASSNTILAQEEEPNKVPFIVGPAACCGWSAASAPVMVAEEEGGSVYTYTGFLTADEEFKFITSADWSGNHYVNPDAENAYIDGDGTLAIKATDDDPDNKFKVSESGNYNVTIDVENLTINVTKADYQDNPIYYNVLYMVGDATPGGWDLKASTPLIQDSENPFVFTTSVDLLASGSFKICVNCFGDFTQKFFFRDEADAAKVSEDDTDDRQWTVEEDGTYDVTVNLLEQTISIEKQGGETDGISTIQRATRNAGAIYTLSGTRVSKAVRGIYIRDGKKFVQK